MNAWFFREALIIMAYISFYPKNTGINPRKAERMFLDLTGEYKLKTTREGDGCISVSFPYGWKQAEGFRTEYRALIKRIQAEGELEGCCAKTDGMPVKVLSPARESLN